MQVPKTYHVFNSIGILRTPYDNRAPYQPVANDEGEFKIILEEKYASGLKLLHTFKYIYVLFALDKIQLRSQQYLLRPPWAPSMEIGVFASRSPDRPNPIGLSVVQIKKIVKSTIYISGIDAFDGSPVLDIKPYLDLLDAKPDANFGWVTETGDETHLALHIKGIAHKH